ncbi:MAG: hypothetical protein JW709_03490 [Sedimentisphaerales bacterium]|nr:hypothetical protein [Sedimentisphaerales bacterium]
MFGKSPLPNFPVTRDCNYVAVFLTMACPYRCTYCINHFETPGRIGRKHLTGKDWIRAFNRITGLERNTGPIPITLQGGEPSVHPDFYEIINDTPERIRLDILTNLSFDVEEMIARVDPQRLWREAPYASIRVSYHPGQANADELLAKTLRLMKAGFSIGVYGVLHPTQAKHILEVQRRAQAEGIDFRTKDFLGYHEGRLYGQYKYPEACSLNGTRTVLCRTTELIIGPDGNVFRCHHDLYEEAAPIGHILDREFTMSQQFQPCDCFGHCNPCDIKVKTNRLQQFGHTSVEIEFTDSPMDMQNDRATATC